MAFGLFGATAQPTELTPAQQRDVDKLIERAYKDDTAWRLVESLTTEIGPRLGGTEAEARAREWAVAQLQALGFKSVRIETYDMPVWTRAHEAAAIVEPFPQPLAVTALGRSVATPDGGLAAEVVRFPTLAALKAAPLEGLEGKTVFVDEPMTRTQDGSGYAVAVAKRSGAAEEAGKRGAVAAIIRSVGTDMHGRSPHAGAMRYAEGVPQIPSAALSNADADQLARAIERAEGPVTVRLDLKTQTQASGQSGNVIAEIPGETNELIVVGGHLDSWDLGTGAVDDGAGIAIVTAAVKLVRSLGKPKRTIRVVYWGAEEVGLYGAEAYAKTHADELSRHVLVGESDFGAGEVWQFQSRFGKSALPKAALIATALRPLGIVPGDNTAFGGADVGPLRDAGVPTFTLRQNGWNYFDIHHTAEDTLDKIDPEKLKQNVAAWAVLLYLASELSGDFRDVGSEAPVASQ